MRSRTPLPEEIVSAVSLIAAQLALALSDISLTADLRVQASCDSLTDEAMYRAKWSGWNRVCLAVPDTCDVTPPVVPVRSAAL